jgi:RHS repeat-associated protein
VRGRSCLGAGQRVQTTANNVTRTMVYDIFGQDIADYTAGALERENIYRGGQLLATQEFSSRTNVALASAGAVATAQNYTQDGVYPGLHFQPSYANDGTRYTSTNGDRYWRDEHGLPSWLEIDFSGSKTIDEVDVFTMRDDYQTQADPSPTQTFANYGVTAFDVQYWNGSSWVTVPGGSITGNNLVWKKINFSAITATKIRVVVNGAIDGVARIAEVEAWGTAASGAGAINYVLQDLQGSTRAVMNNSAGSGTSTIIARHDYLPFGEEISANVGLRTDGQGYSTNPWAKDRVRQRYGLTERDDVTGLDHTWWRKYESFSGRMTTPDPYGGSMSITNPQSFNRYSYVQNDPVNFVDPTGLCLYEIVAVGKETKAYWIFPILCGEPPVDGGGGGPDGRGGPIGGQRGGRKQQPQRQKCKDVANLPAANTDTGALARLLFAEATRISDIGYEKPQADELYAIEGAVLNRVAFLGKPGLKQSQTMGFGNPGASISDVIYSRGQNPSGKSNIGTQFAGFTTNGINSGIKKNISDALNSNADSPECFKLLSAIEAAKNPGTDPFASQGGTFGMRTKDSTALGAPFFQFPNQIQGSNNVFFGLNR